MSIDFKQEISLKGVDVKRIPLINIMKEHIVILWDYGR